MAEPAPAAAPATAAAGALRPFVARLGLDAAWYARETAAAGALRRFARANPRRATAAGALAAAVSRAYPGAGAVEGCAGFLALPGAARLKGLAAYEAGDLYGIDLASGLAVRALGIAPGMSALDLCAAPGAKLCMMADELDRRGRLVAVDASAHRARTCASILKKYRVAEKSPGWECVLVQDDGVTFSHVKPATIVWDAEADAALCAGKHGAKRKRLNKSGRRALARRRLENGAAAATAANPDSSSAAETFDRVLVDAECTHDGSIKHMLKYAEDGFFGQDALQSKLIEADLVKGDSGAQSLQELQQGLLLNGFRRLAPGGTLVYSTCSFSQAQNEDIVRWLLEHPEARPQAKLEALDQDDMFACAPPLPSETLPGTLRFTPTHSGTSGLFLAKLSKRDVQKGREHED